MRLEYALALHAEGEAVRRDPSFWDKLKRLFGKAPELETGRVRANLTTAHLVQGVERALAELGVDNAVALVIDGKVLFEDSAGRAGDLDELFRAFYASEAVYGGELEDLSLTVEHRADGLHSVIEIIGKGEHQLDEATAQVLVGARISELQPRAGETTAAFRQRVMPLIATPDFIEARRLAFDTFCERMRDGIRAALPEVRVVASEARALLAKPAGAAKPADGVTDTRDPRYDPYKRHYPSPVPDDVATLFWVCLSQWRWHPHYVVVDRDGRDIGSIASFADLDLDGFNDDVGEAVELDDGAGEADSGEQSQLGDDGFGDW